MSHLHLTDNSLPILHKPMERSGLGLCALPLNLLALIVSHIDHVDDLARLCRTSRMLHYMAVPQLYKTITLTAHAEIHYKDNIPEGYGNASPFSMGLNALVTRSAATLVKSLILQGEWPQHDLEDKARVGRVPDGSMMLNIAVRAAIDRCVNLECFRWSMNVRLMATAYTGLAQSSSLRRLHLKFSSSRVPQPPVTVPALPNLTSFVMSDYDPLGYPDDLSELFFNATKLEDLILHFSPRMRELGESSLDLLALFRKNVLKQRTLKLRRVAIHNCYARFLPEIIHLFLPDRLECATTINSMGTDDDQFANHFLDSSWLQDHAKGHKHAAIRTFRFDKFTYQMIEDIRHVNMLQNFYFINSRRDAQSNAGSDQKSASSSSTTVTTTPPYSTSTRSNAGRNIFVTYHGFGDSMLSAVCSMHGSSLRHMIIPSRYPLSNSGLAKLTQSCPSLTQLSLALQDHDSNFLLQIASFLRNLRVLRLTKPDVAGDEGLSMTKAFTELESGPTPQERIEMELWAAHEAQACDWDTIKYIGLGNRVWRIGTVCEDSFGYLNGTYPNTDRGILKPSAQEVDSSEVMDIEIWKMDSADVVEWDS